MLARCKAPCPDLQMSNKVLFLSMGVRSEEKEHGISGIQMEGIRLDIEVRFALFVVLHMGHEERQTAVLN